MPVDPLRLDRRARGALALAVALMSFSCGHDERMPTPTAPSNSSGPAARPVLPRLELVAPASVAPGESVQLRVNAFKANDSVGDVTEESQWSSSNTKVIEISPTGVLRGISKGEGFVNVRYQQSSASSSLLVLPTGTYRLTGKVSDEGFGLQGVSVNVIGGAGEGATAVTAADGSYAFYGVGGRVRLQAKRDGYVNTVQDLDVTNNRTFDFEMAPDRPRESVQGAYALTIDKSCSGELPGVDFPRSYKATIEQNGARLNVTLAGGDFIVTRGWGNHFSGMVDGSGRVTLSISGAGQDYYYNYAGNYDFVEQLTNASALTLSGILTGTPTGSRIAGSFSGFFAVMKGVKAPFTQYSSRCYSAASRFEMVRR